MAFLDQLTQRARLERGALSRDAQGGEAVAWSLRDAAGPVLGRQARPPADLRLGADASVTHVLYSLPVPDVQAEPAAPWRFVVDGRTYVVVDWLDPGARGHHLEFRVRRLE